MLARAQSPALTESSPAGVLPSSTTGLQPASDAVAANHPIRAGQGNRLILEAAKKLLTYSTMSMRIRHQIYLFGHHLVGTGAYYQINQKDNSLVRLELKTPVGEDVSSLVQIADGRFLWTHQVIPAIDPLQQSKVEVNRVDLDVLRQVARPNLDISAKQMMLEGLPHLLNQLAIHYRFSKVQPVKLQSIPGFGLIGVRRKLPANGRDEEAELSEPVLIPEQVRIVLGREDLFPFLFEFHDKMNRPTLILELFEVQLSGDVDPLLFLFKPRGLTVTDMTREHVEMVRTLRQGQAVRENP